MLSKKEQYLGKDIRNKTMFKPKLIPCFQTIHKTAYFNKKDIFRVAISFENGFRFLKR